MSHKISDFEVQLAINPELFEFQTQMKEKLYDFNHARPSQHALKATLLGDILGSYNGATIVPPFYCDMGKNIHFAEGGFLNSGVTILDIAPVYFGRYVQIGPNVVISTAGHPLDIAERVLPLALGNPIHIGDSVWIGAGAVVVDGVTIGARSVIGAGSVVTKDIPEDCLAFGNPCKVIRKLEHGEVPSEEELYEMWKPMIELKSSS
ncbi:MULTISPECIES: sugar O-acetyltransferase [unclassified Motilimonas]|uniref:sugar O-acetyltransferase n=1 Tax=Motilimonas TaxID=1914248 RepID=UPI001E579AC2|nr:MULTISPECIES: sugar O-acetyltransferase [unclassified Motilimonas]MCE0558407.1 sugar O-acetyltransferase [Motilimonas sp. E26]MDO6526621.1 sugar O-acetyltransferase [Motilimonas sp. 1_MG-2023]